jgi:hypothetical protein
MKCCWIKAKLCRLLEVRICFPSNDLGFHLIGQLVAAFNPYDLDAMDVSFKGLIG